MKSRLIIILLMLFSIFTTTCYCAIPEAKVTLFAKTGSGDYYTLYSNGIKKENANIGSFKSAQLDSLEENIYFYDDALKVIAKINLKDGKVYKVIGKPKSTGVLDYSKVVSFDNASLNKLLDFTFDKYGNIFILYSNSFPKILKASFKDKTIKEVFSLGETFNLDTLSYDHNRFIYITGNLSNKEPVIVKFDPLTNTNSIYAGGNEVSNLGYTPKLELNTSSYYKILGLAFDHNNTCYLSSQDYQNSKWSYFTHKLIPSEDLVIRESYIGDSTGSTSDIGDGGLAKSAYAILVGSRYLCNDKNGDIFIADNANNRVRKIFANSGLIATVIGGGNESVTFGQLKSLTSIALQSPNTFLVDKFNNLYIVENNRILLANNVVTHDENSTQLVKIANLSIAKIAGNEVTNSKGEIATPDLNLDYTYHGEQIVEVKGENIPDGTSINLLTINSDGTTTLNQQKGAIKDSIATIPISIEAGTTKIIKAETDPFIPAPGVYLAGTAPKIEAGELPPEPIISTANRDNVNLEGNLLNQSIRFNFFESVGWKKYKGGTTKSNIAIDPDNVVSDASLIDFGSSSNTIYLENQAPNSMGLTFSLWMRTASENIIVPIGIGPFCPGPTQYQYWASPGWEGCNNANLLANNYQSGNIPALSLTKVTVTPTWQKFSITTNTTNSSSSYKTLYIGGLNQTTNQKIYMWGARLEASQ